jgi:hypothetical protein
MGWLSLRPRPQPPRSPWGPSVSSRWTSPGDVQEVARRKAGQWLSGVAAGDGFVPLRVPVRGPSAGELGPRFDEVRQWAGEWERAARGPLRVEYKKVGGRSFGVNEIPGAAWVEGYEQAWALLGLAGDAARLSRLVEQTSARYPRLVPWLIRRPARALELAGEWDRLLATVGWIDSRDVSGLYLRQVDVPGVDTKFIGQHRGILSELLDLQLEPQRVDSAADGFEGRYGFRGKPGYVRLRLGSRIAWGGFSELAVRVDELTGPPQGTARVCVVENEVTYLALPLAADAIVILGAGYAVGLLEPLTWLADLDVVYWGDIDTHGFAILDRLRRHFPAVTSMLMDRDTLLAHRSQWVTEAAPAYPSLTTLSPEELGLYQSLIAGEYGPAVRLEQERVNFARVWRALGAAGH